MSRLAVGLLCSLVVTGFSRANAEEPHQVWMQFMKGKWTYAYENTGLKGEVKYSLAAKRHAVISRGLEEDDAWAEVIGWRPDTKKMVFTGYGAKNDTYWHIECGELSQDRIAGDIFGILPDGRAFKGKVVFERDDDDTFVIVLSAKTGDDKLEDTGKFCRVKE